MATDAMLRRAVLVFGFGAVMFGIVGVGLVVDYRNRKRIRRQMAHEGGRVLRIKRIMIATKKCYIPVHYDVSYVDNGGEGARRLGQTNRHGVFWKSDDFASELLKVDGRSWP